MPNVRYIMRSNPWPTLRRSWTRLTRTKDFGELADAPVAALQGVSDGDAEHLKAAFGIDTIRELATNEFVLWAQAINVLAK